MTNDGTPKPWGVEMGGALLANFIFPSKYIGQIWYVAAESVSSPWDLWDGEAYCWELLTIPSRIQSLCFGTGKSYQDALQSLQLALQAWLMSVEIPEVSEDIEKQALHAKRQIGFSAGNRDKSE